MKKRWPWHWKRMDWKTWCFVPVVALAAWWAFSPFQSSTVDVPYRDFLVEGRSGHVAEVVIEGQHLLGTYRSGSKFTTLLPPAAPDLPAFLDAHGVQFSYTEPRPILAAGSSLLSAILPWVIIAVVLRKLLTPGSVTKAKVVIVEPGQEPTRLDDVAGVQEVKADLLELVDFLKQPGRYTAMGARVPRGVVLYGPPGTGKTLLARAVAGEAGVSFVHFSASEFVELYVGVGAGRVRDLFAQAQKKAPCIIFIDELDAVGRKRHGGGAGGNEERDQTLNQLLVEMDGFEGSAGIIVLAATNRMEVLDQALLRPGRFDRHIGVGLPDVAERLQILQVHARGKRMDPACNLELLARRTPGFSGADLANVMNEAALLAVRNGRSVIADAELDSAAERVMAGGPEKKGRVMSADERRRIAVHEAGHVMVARALPDADPVTKVSIVARGQAGGYTLMVPDEDRRLWTKRRIDGTLTVLLGGRAAEQLLLGDVSSGAQNDLERATQMARQMVACFGMSDSVGPMAVLDEMPGIPASAELAAEVDREVRRILREASNRAATMLQICRSGLELLADELIRRETIDGKELDRLLSLAAHPTTPEPRANE